MNVTVSFDCPKCAALIAFDAKHAGKRAHCRYCGQSFLVPARTGQIPQKIELETEKELPLPGFYRAAFLDAWKIFVDPRNVTSLAFVAAAVCFKFFLANAICCVNYITYVVVWGWLLGFYLNIIYESAFDIETLPQVCLGDSVTFIWHILGPFLTFSLTMALVQAPLIIALIVLQDKGLTFFSIWQAHSGYNLLLQAFFLCGLFLFPAAILTTAVGKDFTLLRIDYLILSISRLFVPYVLVVALIAAAAFLEIRTAQYTHAALHVTAANLAINLAVQVLAIAAMRAVGLLYKHYACRFPW